MGKLRKIHVYSDGACTMARGKVGGWGTVIRDELLNYEREMYGIEVPSTNNRMEITGALKGLEAIYERCEVTVVTDSMYLVGGIEQGWIKKWISRNWVTSTGKPVVNRDLWEQLWEVCQKHVVHFQWVKGHNGHPFNERCDRLAAAAISEYFLRNGPYDPDKMRREFR